MRSVFRDLSPEFSKYGASDIVVVGGAGVLSMLPELRPLLPPSAMLHSVCDGCVLADLNSSFVAKSAETLVPSHTWATAPPSLTLLPATLRRWGVPQPTRPWRNILSAPVLVRQAARAGARQLIAHNLYDATVFSQYGQPVANTSFAVALRKHMLQQVSSSPFHLALSCTGPEAAFVRSAFFDHVEGSGMLATGEAAMLYSLLYDKEPGPRSGIVDECVGVNCNPSCLPSTYDMHI